MADVKLQTVTRHFGAVEVIRGIDLTLNHGEFCVFVGPSGCGKSTLLRMIAGLETVSSGQIAIGARDVTALPPSDRGVAMVFQSYALYPHMTVEENIGFGLRMTGHDRPEIARRTAEAARLLQLEPMLKRKPGQLSGGQRQRVAIGRAIVRQPDVFLFDEPLSNLDANLRVQMRSEIMRLHKDLGATMIYVTHDQVEAMTMADRIVVLNGGYIEQEGSPLELYHRPKNLFVAGFIGNPKMNFLKAGASAVPGGTMVSLGQGASVTLPGVSVATGPVTLGIRPEHMVVGAPADSALTGTIRMAEHLGAETFFTIEAGGQELIVRADGLAPGRIGETIRVGLNAKACHLFNEAGLALHNGDLTV